MSIQILRPEISDDRRIIAISDIHGNYSVFCSLLEKVKITTEDVLILIGDVIEKGPYSLATLRLIMEMTKEYEVYCVVGNHDLIYKELLRNDRNEELLEYLMSNRKSMIADMCEEAGIQIQVNMDVLQMKYVLRECFADEIGFLDIWPHVIEISNFVFAHAQVLPGSLEEQLPAEVVRAEAFMDKGYAFEKYIVVGHWPVMLYDKNRRSANPIINKVRKIISIDGGNCVKKDGQLNALIIPNRNSEDFTYEYEDDLRKAKVLNTQTAGDFHNVIDWTDNLVKPLQYKDDFVYCRHESTEKNYWIPKDYLWEKEDGWHTNDFTDYQLRLTFGDVVSVIEETSRGYIVKKEGITGWYYGMLEYEPMSN